MSENARNIANELVEKLTLDQKVAMLHQHAPALPDLGLACFHTGAEAAHGVAWLGEATVFPQTVGLAATWDAELIERVGHATGRELRAKQSEDPEAVGLNAWAPVVNPLRHPLWGRNEEGFSEDPHLTAELANAYCKGLRGSDPATWMTVPTLKHFLAYNNEIDRNVTSSQLRERVLHEYELPAFQKPIESGQAGAVMLSYNLVNGRPAHVSDLVNDHLRQWENGEEIAIVTDAGAPSSLFRAEKYFQDGASAYAAALRAGVDNFTDDDSNPLPSIGYLNEALSTGLLTEEDIDRSVLRLLTLRARTGEFSGGEAAYAGIGAQAIGTRDHVDLAREAAAKSVVLLRNAGKEKLLPLDKATKKLAVIGSMGERVLADWYSGTLQHEASIVDGLSERFSNVSFEEGTDIVALRCVRTGGYLSVTAGQNGRAEHDCLISAGHKSAPQETESFVLKDWGRGEHTLLSVANGSYVTGSPDGYARANAPRIGGWVVQESLRLLRDDSGLVAIQHVASGKWGRIESGTGSLVLVTGTQADADRFSIRTLKSGHVAARDAAASADTVIIAVGNDPHLGGRETLDRDTLALPQAEQELIRVVHDANPSTVLVLVSSYPYSLGGLTDIPAILWMSHGGQELGRGLADVLSGASEPTGRLPQTWYARDEDLPNILDYDIISSASTYLYSAAEPLFPLGHGLGYAVVRYEALNAPSTAHATDPHVQLEVQLANDSERDAHELVQVYAASPNHRFGFPRRLLVAHQRVLIPAGRNLTVTLTVALSRLGTFSTVENRMVVEPGTYHLLVGSSAQELPLAASVEVAGSRPADRDPRTRVPARYFDACHNLALVPETALHGTGIAVDDDSYTAYASYKYFKGALSGRAALSIAPGFQRPEPSGSTVALQVAGAADTWRTLATAVIPAGFTGEMEFGAAIDVPVAADSAFTVRLAITGTAVVSAFCLDADSSTT